MIAKLAERGFTNPIQKDRRMGVRQRGMPGEVPTVGSAGATQARETPHGNPYATRPG